MVIYTHFRFIKYDSEMLIKDYAHPDDHTNRLLEHGHTHSANQCPAFRCPIFHKLS